MAGKRTDRLNSLLREVLSDVIRGEVKNPEVSPMTTVTQVQISKDLRHAKVYVSVIGSDLERSGTVDALNSCAGFIAVSSSKKMVIRHFPQLTFWLDDSVEKQMRIQDVLSDIEAERRSRNGNDAEQPPV